MKISKVRVKLPNECSTCDDRKEQRVFDNYNSSPYKKIADEYRIGIDKAAKRHKRTQNW